MFNRGYMAGGEIVDSMNRAVDGILAAREIRAAAALEKENSDRIGRWSAAYSKVRIVNAANYAEKHALRAALARLDPNHPLIKNKALQEKIHAAAEQVAVLSDFDYEAIMKAGRDYQY